ncbi:MAG: hypothetical protein UR15_C0039G0002 [Parcubacteria group bacterium GW2011_GWA2_31_28]|nr:MAG: hypothetical protein UR15_C0039G0002 [Parcubacteria group bacterium GW2011_GWA2_31_28]
MKYIKKLTEHFSWLLVIVGYVAINIIFNYRVYWHQLITDLSKTGAVYGEVQVYEWALEKFYQSLISGHNPFGTSTAILYPFGLNFSMLDLGNGLFFPLLRPFLSTHQTMFTLVTVSLIIANIGMYLLLRKLNFNKVLSFIIGAAYGYMTFLMPRGGHLSYWSALWINLYYFVILLISIFSFIIYFLLLKTKIFFTELIRLWNHISLIALFVFLLSIPWLKGSYDFFIFDSVPKTQGWGGAIEFSSDLFNYFLPSGYSYLFTKFPILLKPFSLVLKLYTPEARSIFENFTYPGIIILFSYFSLIFIYKKFDKKIKENIKPFLFVSIVFFILTLGPFLHVFGHWTLMVDEGIKIVIPLPYIILHYIPFLNNIRVPGRLIVGFIFFAYIVCAYIINYLLKNKSVRYKQVFFVILFLVFFVDHRVIDNVFPAPQVYPYKIFQTIKADPKKVSVLEIPFTVRDGFTYFGNGNAIGMTVGQLIHGKSVLGGYIGRIADYKKNYYRLNPFLGYIGRIIDEGLLVNPIIDKEDLINWQKINIANSKRTIDFLDIKYLINNDEELYSASLSAIYQDLGYEKKLVDGKYSLWEKKPDRNEYKNILINNPDDRLFLGFGWHEPENDFRWSDKRSSVMFKIQKTGKYLLNFETAAFYKDQSVTVYLNKEKVAKINISTKMREYSIPITTKFEEGINTVYFMFDKYYLPSGIIPGSLDERRLSGKFSKIWLVNQQ